MIFFAVMEMDLHMVVNQHPRLSPSLYKQCCHITNFKMDFHRAYVKAMKDPTRTWHPFPYLVTEDDLFTVVQQWLEEWMNPPSGAVGTKKGTSQDAGTSGKDEEIETEEIDHENEEPLIDVELSEESPFIVRRRETKTTIGKRKKHKENKSKGA